MIFPALLILAYLIGSLSASIILAKLCGLPDPRESGSKNAGATNTLRTNGKKNGAIVLVADLFKGSLCVILAYAFRLQSAELGLVALCAVLGHIFPCYFNFKGGKGVATALGALLICCPKAAFIVVLTWIIIAHFSHYVSLASMCACLIAPFSMLFIAGASENFIPFLIISGLIIWRHKDNIQRLKDKKESKVNLFGT